MALPPVDVIIPVYNGHDAVARCLESVLAHTPGPDVRLVVADDASPDPRLPGLLASFAARDPRVTVVRRDPNLGFVRNCNRAMQEAAGRRRPAQQRHRRSRRAGWNGCAPWPTPRTGWAR